MPRAKARKEEPAEAESDIVMEEAPTSHQPESRDDMSVDQDENDEAGEVEEEEIEEEEEDVQRVRLVCEIFIPKCWVYVKKTSTDENTSFLAQHRQPRHSNSSMRATPLGTP